MFSTISNSQTVTLPYSEGFDSDDAESSFTIIDVNDDYTTWSISDGKAEYFNLFSDSQADDWLITPSFYLEAGKSYQFSFKANTYDLSETGTFEAKLGSENTAEAMTIEVLPETSVSTDQPTDFTKIISVETSGVYYFGIHCLNQPEMTNVLPRSSGEPRPESGTNTPPSWYPSPFFDAAGQTMTDRPSAPSSSATEASAFSPSIPAVAVEFG